MPGVPEAEEEERVIACDRKCKTYHGGTETRRKIGRSGQRIIGTSGHRVIGEKQKYGPQIRADDRWSGKLVRENVYEETSESLAERKIQNRQRNMARYSPRPFGPCFSGQFRARVPL